MSPGPCVNVIASISSIVTFACFIASVMTVLIFSTWILLATSGTTPPYCVCTLICEDTMFDNISFPSFTMAHAVSSQLLSSANNIVIIFSPKAEPLNMHLLHQHSISFFY